MRGIIRNRADLVLTLLFADAGASNSPAPVSGITRLEKLLFLLTLDEGFLQDVPKSDSFTFVPFRMGPWTQEVYDEVDFLESLGLISKDSTVKRSAVDAAHDDELFSDLVVDKYQKSAATQESDEEVFRLTEQGKEKALAIWSRLGQDEKARLLRVKNTFNNMNLKQFLRYVYRKHPEHTSESEIKGYLGLRD